jgi:hypothetical protein
MLEMMETVDIDVYPYNFMVMKMSLEKLEMQFISYLDSNREEFTNYNFEKDGNIITSDKYIDTIKINGEWMGELEIYALVLYITPILLSLETIMILAWK